MLFPVFISFSVYALATDPAPAYCALRSPESYQYIKSIGFSVLIFCISGRLVRYSVSRLLSATCAATPTGSITGE